MSEPEPGTEAPASPPTAGDPGIPPPAKRRFVPRFSLRSLTLCVLLAASAMSVWSRWAPWTLLAVVPGRTYAFFSPDSRRMVNFNLQEMVLQAWDTRTGQLADRWTGPTTDVRFARYSPDGRFVTGWTFGNPFWNAETSTDADKPKILLWQPGRSEPLAEFAPDERANSDAGLEPAALDGGRLIFCPRACALWDVEKKAPRWSLFDAKRTHLLSGIYSEDEMRRDHETAAAEAPKARTLETFAGMAGGKAKFTVRAAPDVSLMVSHIRGASQAAVWNLPLGRKLGAIELPARWEKIQRMVFAADGSKVALVCEGSGETRIYSTRSFEALATLPKSAAEDGGAQGKDAEWEKMGWCESSEYVILIDEFAEVELKGLRVLDRAELRAVCDREKTKEKIVQALSE